MITNDDGQETSYSLIGRGGEPTYAMPWESLQLPHNLRNSHDITPDVCGYRRKNRPSPQEEIGDMHPEKGSVT